MGTSVHRIGRRLLGAMASAVGAGALVVASAPAAVAAPAVEPAVTSRETVQVHLDANGNQEYSPLLYSQLTVRGNGAYRIVDPTSTKNLRNLDAFQPPATRPNEAIWNVAVRGVADRRTVSTFTKELPVTVQASYRMNGVPAEPADLVGASGRLEVRYTVRNVTAEPTRIRYRDAAGNPVTRTVDIVTPYVGQLQTALPRAFSRLEAARADITGDGRGGNTMSWTMVLFEPLGAATQTFGYSATVEDMELPPASVQVTPVPPKHRPELASGAEAFQSVAATGRDFTAGATQLDTNVVGLRNAATRVFVGLRKLHTGAEEFATGLEQRTLPDARRLAAGTQRLDEQAQQLDRATGTATRRASELADEAGTASDLAASVDAGAGAAATDDAARVSGDADEVAAQAERVSTGASDLRAGIAAVADGLRGLNDASTGLPAARDEAAALLAQVGTVQTRLDDALSALTARTDGFPAAKTRLDRIRRTLAVSNEPGRALDQLTRRARTADRLLTLARRALDCTANREACRALNDARPRVADLADGLPRLRRQTAGVLTGLAAVSAGLGDAVAGVRRLETGTTDLAGIRSGLGDLVGGLTVATRGVGDLAAGTADAADRTSTVAGDADAVSSGAAEVAGGSDALAGQLGGQGSASQRAAASAARAAAAATELSDLLSTRVDPEARQLADGTSPRATAADRLAGRVDDATTSSERFARALGQTNATQRELVTGSRELYGAGTETLAENGAGRTSGYAEEYAVMLALDRKGANGALPYGAPRNSVGGSSAFVYTLAGANDAVRRDTSRGLAGAGLLLLGIGAPLILRWRSRAAQPARAGTENPRGADT